MIPKISLEQWATFKAVVDEGSFAKAAEALNKSQSTVSYSLTKMEERLPARVFEQAGRKAELTGFGHAMYRQATTILAQALQIDQTASYLASGWEEEIVIAVDALASMEQVFCALHNFSKESPDTRIRVLETTLSGTEEVLLQREADIVITARVPPGFLAENYGFITKVPVVAPQHSLAMCTDINEDTLKSHRQIVIRDTGTRRTQDAGWLGANQRWTVSHFSTSIAAIKAGLGFGFIPREMIQGLLDKNELVELHLTYGESQKIPLYIVASAQSNAGLATQAVFTYLRKSAMK